MKRKRFVKLLMAQGYSRNEAADKAALTRALGYDYGTAHELSNTYGITIGPEVMKRAVAAVADAIPTFVQAICEAIPRMCQAITDAMPAVIEAARRYKGIENPET